ncbi:MAG: cobalamin-dependent protein [Oscillospiraceae bacterium]|nr:cobalamin-dependent protein [Oscillospiraceae bacterium]
MSVIAEIGEALQKGKKADVEALVRQALDEGGDPQVILEDGLLAGMGRIGEQFKKNEVYVPEVLIAARAMNAGAALLKPYLAEAGVGEKGVVVLGTVKGDLHDIGKNLVKMMMEGKGLRVVDLGVDVPAARFIGAAEENGAQVIACSALLTTTMGEMKNVVEARNASSLAGKVQIMIGGAPVNQSFCDQIGADVYTASAADAADLALELCG